jgi:hypothetical protein
MDINKKWVHFEDTLELEIFLNLCEEKGYSWYGDPVRKYLEEDLSIYKHYDRVGYGGEMCGYYAYDHRIYGVTATSEDYTCSSAAFDSKNRFTLEVE